MSYPKIVFFILILSAINVAVCQTEKQPEELRQFTNESMFDVNDTTCIDISGEWVGEEIQYDPTKSFIRTKFKVVFQLKQEGNKITGITFFEEKLRKNYGDMKIRGVVIGNKFHFEEYEIIDEKMYSKNKEWCLRSGVLDIEIKNGIATLSSLYYDGFTSVDYLICTDHAETVIHKKVNANDTSKEDLLNKQIDTDSQLELNIYPNPFKTTATIKYKVLEKSNIQISVYSLSGQLIENIMNKSLAPGEYENSLQSELYNSGVYVVIYKTNHQVISKQIVKTR